MRLVVEELRYARVGGKFVAGLSPYAHQLDTLQHVREAIRANNTICIENASATGSGKTLANFAATILDNTHTCGVYPTNELLLDQYGAIQKHLPAQEIAILDSQGLDDIIKVEKHILSHAQALSWATGDDMRTALLTNPDVLYLAMYNLYGQMFSNFAQSYGARIFQNILSNYPVIAFDEFHLYSAKQIANAAFIVGTARELAPDKPHVFIFSSATPQDQFKQYLQRLGLATIPVTDTSAATGHVVCEPMEINLLPADLLRWQGGDAIRNILEEILNWADSCDPLARGVFIVDSVYEAKRIAEELRRRYPSTDVGEVHGYMSPDERAVALLRRFSVGTTTIDVGVDLTDQKSKEFLVCEARSAAQAIQRIGRLGRHGREPQNIKVPNRVWLAVPEYVYHFIANREDNGASITREKLNKTLKEAYLDHEEFINYTYKYSPLEAVAACERVLQSQYFEDTRVYAQEKLHLLLPTLYDRKPPAEQGQAEMSYTRHHKCQMAVWNKFGTEIKNPNRKRKKYFLSDLESFRGGLESDFTVAIYDELDEVLSMKPIKTYNLPFVLRRTQYRELSKQQFTELVMRKHPEQAGQWLKELEQQQQLLGYLHVHGLVEGKANEMYFEISKKRIDSQFHQVVRLESLTIGGGDQLRNSAESINSELKKRRLNCWISQHKSFKLSESLHLPPLFAIYPLHALSLGGKYDEWSVAFGLDAFLLDSISNKVKWAHSHSENTAIII